MISYYLGKGFMYSGRYSRVMAQKPDQTGLIKTVASGGRVMIRL